MEGRRRRKAVELRAVAYDFERLCAGNEQEGQKELVGEIGGVVELLRPAFCACTSQDELQEGEGMERNGQTAAHEQPGP